MKYNQWFQTAKGSMCYNYKGKYLVMRTSNLWASEMYIQDCFGDLVKVSA